MKKFGKPKKVPATVAETAPNLIRTSLDLERAVLTKMVTSTQEAALAIRLGMTQRHFHDPEHAALYEHAVKSVQEHGAALGLGMLNAYFPRFTILRTDSPIAKMAEELRERQYHVEAAAVLDEIRQALADRKEVPSTIVSKFQRKLSEVASRAAPSEAARRLPDAVSSIWADYELTKETGGIVGIPTPWEPLNIALGGFQPEQYIVVTARPKVGKTWFTEVLAAYVASMGYPVLFKTIEMSRTVIERRFAAILSGVEYGRFRNGRMTQEEETKVLDTLASIHDEQLPITVIGREPGDNEMVSLRGHVDHYQPALVVIDGVYLLGKDRGHEEQGAVSTAIKRFAQDAKLPVIASTQLNREAGDEKEASLSNVAFSDAYAQDADGTIALRRGREERLQNLLRVELPGQRESAVDAFWVNWLLCSDFSLHDTPDFAQQQNADEVSQEETPPEEETA